MGLSKKARWGTVAAVVGVAAIATTAIITLKVADQETQETPAADLPDPPDYDVADCKASPLKVDGSTWGGTVTAVSPSGEYILGEGDSVLWGPDNETVKMSKTVEEKLKGAATSEPLDVNSRGEVVGESYTKSRKTVMVWKYSEGEVTELRAPEKYSKDGGLQVEHINDNGTAVGTPSSDGPDAILKWEPDGGAADVLVKDPPKDAHIADDGTVLDTKQSSGKKMSKTDLNGEREKLPFAFPSPKGEDAGITQVSGDWMLLGTNAGTYRWNMAKQGKAEKVDLDIASAIDARGRVFGQVDDKPSVVTDSKVEDLPVPDGADPEKFSPAAVGSHSGVLAGTGKTKNGNTAMRWDCD